MMMSQSAMSCSLAGKGFLRTDAGSLDALISTGSMLIVLLQSDPNKYPTAGLLFRKY